LLRYTAARIGEVLQLRPQDVFDERCRVLDEIQYRQETRKGKDKNHCVPVCPQLKALLLTIPCPSEKQAWLFPSPRNPENHMSYEGTLKYLKYCAEKAGISGKVTTHSGRRSCITALARKGTDLRTIQEISGHASITNLARYIQTDPETTRHALSAIEF
jgi:integrase/recombinase XerD